MAATNSIAFYLSVGACLFIIFLVIVLYGVIGRDVKTSEQAGRLYGIVLTFSYIVSIATFAIGFYWFNDNPAQMIQLLLFLAILMFPMALTALSVSSAQLAALRDALAAGQQVGAVVA